MKKLIKILLSIIVLIIILAGALCVIATRPFFIKRVIIPIAEKNINASISYGNLELHPFDTSVLLTDLNLKSADGYSIKSGRIYALVDIWDIIHGRITVNRVDLENTYIEAVNSPDRVQPAKGHPGASGKKASPSGSPLYLSISNINVKNMNVNYETKGKTPAETSVLKVSNLNITVPELKTGGRGLVNIAGDILTSRGDASNILNGRIESTTTLSMDDSSFPISLESKTMLTFGDKATPMNFSIATNGKAFNFHGEIDNLNFDPFFNAFMQAPMNDSTGYVGKLVINAEGPDYQSPDVVMDITGDARLNLRLEGMAVTFKSGGYNFKFNLSDILNNRINIRKISLNDTTVNVVKTKSKAAAVSSQTPAPAEEKVSNQKAPAKPLLFDLNNIEIKNFNATYVDRTGREGDKSTAQLNNFNLTVPVLKTGSAGNLTYDGGLSISAGGNNFNGNINGTSQIMLDSYNMPVTLDSQNNIKLNDVSSSLCLSASSTDGKSLKFKMTLGYLDLNPLLSMFVEDNDKAASGHIDAFEISGESTDAQSLDINTKVSGKVELNLAQSASTYNIDTGYFDLGFNVKDIVDKNISIEHFNIDQTKIKIVQNASSIRKPASTTSTTTAVPAEKVPPRTASEGLPFSIDLNNVFVKNLDFIYNSIGRTKKESSSLKVSDFNLSIPKLMSNGKGQIDLSANIASSSGDDSKTLDGHIESKTSVTLNKNLFPTQLSSNTDITFGKQVTPVTLTITTENEKAFKFTGNINSLDLAPVFSTFTQGAMKSSTGCINGLTINASGEDIASTKITADVTCSAKASIVNDTGLYNLGTEKFYVLVNIDDFLHNKIAVRQLDLDNTNIEIIKMVTKAPADTSKNAQPAGAGTQAAPGSHPALDLNNIGVRNLSLAYILRQEDGTNHNASRISKLNISIPSLKTNERGSIDYNGEISVSSAETGNTLTGKITGKTDVQLNESMLPDYLESASKLELGQNVTPVNASLKTKEDKKFMFSADIRELPLDPIFQTFLQGSLNKSNGFMKFLSIKGDGNDMQSPNVADTLNADITAGFSNINIPVELMKMPVTQVLFLPIQLISELNKYLGVNVFSDEANKMLADAANTIKGAKPLEFSRGDVDIGIRNRNVYLRKLLFLGADQSAISKLDVHGNITDFKNLNLDTLTIIAKFNLPIHIEGTIENPKPDMSRLAVQFVGSNVDNIVGTVKKTATLLGNNLNADTRQILQALPDDSDSTGASQQQPGSSQNSGYNRTGRGNNNSGSQQQAPAEEIIKAGTGLLKNLFN